MSLLPEPYPVALGFAGGIEIRNADTPALSAYTQVQKKNIENICNNLIDIKITFFILVFH